MSLIESKEFQAKAILLGERLDLKSLERSTSLDNSPLTIEVRGGGIAVLYRYGVVVLFDISSADEAVFLDSLQPFIREPIYSDEFETEEVLNIVIKNGIREQVDAQSVYISSVNLESLQVIADVLSKSLILESYEIKVAKHFDRVEPIALQLQNGKYSSRDTKEMLQHLASTLLSEHKMVGRVEVSENPEVLWEHTELEGLYHRLRDEFEIKQRHSAIDRKLNLISKTAETLLELGQHRHSSRLEWYIIILIAIEIMLSVYELFIK